MLSTEDLKTAVCKVVDEQDFTNYQKKRLKKSIRKKKTLDNIDLPPEWAWRICAARLMDGHLDWWGWEARSDVIWDLCHIDWQYPKWDGRPSDLYVVAEQGIGDEILFSNAYGDLLNRTKATIEVDSRLIPAFERTFGKHFESRWRNGVGDPTPLDVPRGKHTAFMPAANALKLFRKNMADFPGPWIEMDSYQTMEWRDEMEDCPKPWVGVSWTGRQGNIDPSIFSGGTLFNLNYDGTTHPDIEQPHYESFDDMWHFISALDRVDTVTNTTFHMAGSIGVPCNVIRPSKMYGEVNNILQWQTGKMLKHVYPTVEIFDTEKDYQNAQKESSTQKSS